MASFIIDNLNYYTKIRIKTKSATLYPGYFVKTICNMRIVVIKTRFISNYVVDTIVIDAFCRFKANRN